MGLFYGHGFFKSVTTKIHGSYVMLCYVMLCYIVLFYDNLYILQLYYVTLPCVMSRYVMFCMLRRVKSCYVTLRYVTLLLYLSIYLSTYLPIYLSIYLSIYI